MLGVWRVATREIFRGAPRGFRYQSQSAIPEGREKAMEQDRKMGSIVPHMEFFDAYANAPISRYRVMDQNGEISPGAEDPKVGKEMAVKMYKDMVRLHIMDGYLYDVQRQGRISFYMTNYGEEASHVGSAAALDSHDTVYGQYRESGVLMWRGFTIQQFMDQCYSNKDDVGKGRQMPVHYGSDKLCFQTISSPLSTQIPQATGYAYALKHSGSQNCVICYFGDGAASEGDFHAALNAAATLEAPVIFFCRNNQYAISTEVQEQYRGDGIASRGTGYGIEAIRVDGNDIWAVYNATKAARRTVVEESRPILIEAMSYRISHHSTSDDSTRYRSMEEIDFWKNENNPIQRLNLYLTRKGWWNEDKEKSFRDETAKDIVSCLKKAEAKLKPPLSDMFLDVYAEKPPHLLEQEAQFKEFLEKHGKNYPTKAHTSEY